MLNIIQQIFVLFFATIASIFSHRAISFKSNINKGIMDDFTAIANSEFDKSVVRKFLQAQLKVSFLFGQWIEFEKVISIEHRMYDIIKNRPTFDVQFID